MKSKWFKGISKEDAIKGGKFLVYFILVFAVLFLVFGFLVSLKWIEEIVAIGANFFLGLFGLNGAINSGAEPIMIAFPNFFVQISYLCTGLFEMTLLIAAIIATLGIKWKKKLVGAIGAVIGIYFFNLFRIITTIIAIDKLELNAAEAIHDVLFRLSLLVVVAGFYFVWYEWATKKKKA